MLKTQESSQIADHMLQRVAVQSLGAGPDKILYGSDSERFQCSGIFMEAYACKELLQIPPVGSNGRWFQTADSAQMIREIIEFYIYCCIVVPEIRTIV